MAPAGQQVYTAEKIKMCRLELAEVCAVANDAVLEPGHSSLIFFFFSHETTKRFHEKLKETEEMGEIGERRKGR